MHSNNPLLQLTTHVFFCFSESKLQEVTPLNWDPSGLIGIRTANTCMPCYIWHSFGATCYPLVVWPSCYSWPLRKLIEEMRKQVQSLLQRWSMGSVFTLWRVEAKECRWSVGKSLILMNHFYLAGSYKLFADWRFFVTKESKLVQQDKETNSDDDQSEILFF